MIVKRLILITTLMTVHFFGWARPLHADADSSTQAYVKQAEANAAAGHYHVAIYFLEKALAESPKNVTIWRASARLLDKTGHPALARMRWKHVADLAPGDPEAIRALRNQTATPTQPMANPKLNATPEPGVGMWLSGGSREQIKMISAYNSKSPMGQRVRYLFVKSGEWILDGDNSHWNLDLDQALMAIAEQGGDVDVYLWIEGSSQGAENISASTWERLGTELATAVQANRLGGIDLSPSCCGEQLYPLYAALRRHLGVPLCVEVGADEPSIFQYADFVVLRPVPASGSIDAYKDRVQDLAAGFLKTAHDVDGKAMVGLSGLGPSDSAQWFTNARRALSVVLPSDGNAFLGVSVWGLVADDEGRISQLAPGIWINCRFPYYS